MAFTQAQLDALDAAIASGTLTIRHGEKTITYQSFDDLLKAREMIARSLAGARVPRFQLADFRDA